ncbi:MAG: MGH1-like glycoside hydrolase domain-containing protein, partial [Myxococcaceae bacterium]
MLARLGPSSGSTAEHQRLEQSRARTRHWKRWGPYLSERSWGTVREDYSPGGTAWDDFPHEHARSRAYRWNEDGLAGISDRHQTLCFALSLWNGRDPILKERLFGLTGQEGNHGEDVKELYFYLDSTPTHSFMRYLYKYPQAAFPYAELVERNRAAGRGGREVELLDTGVFDGNRYFDVEVDYAKADAEDILVRVRVTNRGPEAAGLDVLPTLWFRNTWSWNDGAARPRLQSVRQDGEPVAIRSEHPLEGVFFLHLEGKPELLFSENDTNLEKLWGARNASPYVKDAFDSFIVHGRREAVNPAETGTKSAVHQRLTVGPGETRTLRLRLNRVAPVPGAGVGSDFDQVFQSRKREADKFYETVIPASLSADAKNVMRQALGGLLWSKQYYHYVLRDWLHGDPAQPKPPDSRMHGRNSEWGHIYNADVLSMPDKWEYPWFAAWDLAFHCIPLALVDSDFAKDQLLLLLREWFMHPNGQIPAYEWAFGDVNPPVFAWAALRVYQIEKKRSGRGDTAFLRRVFHKLMLNFTWWVNRKDAEGRNVFQGGFLGLDNIGVFDRSNPLPTGGFINQADGTSWMAMYSLNLLRIAAELAMHNHVYEDIASKFFEHFLSIAGAINGVGEDCIGLWDETDQFYYDHLCLPDGTNLPLKIQSAVG